MPAIVTAPVSQGYQSAAACGVDTARRATGRPHCNTCRSGRLSRAGGHRSQSFRPDQCWYSDVMHSCCLSIGGGAAIQHPALRTARIRSGSSANSPGGKRQSVSWGRAPSPRRSAFVCSRFSAPRKPVDAFWRAGPWCASASRVWADTLEFEPNGLAISL